MLLLLGIKQYSNNNSLADSNQRDLESGNDSNVTLNSLPLTLSLPPVTRSGPNRFGDKTARNRNKMLSNITYSESNTTDDSLISAAFVTSKACRKKLNSKPGSRQSTPKSAPIPSPQETIYQQTMLMEKLYEALNQQTQMLQAIQAMQNTNMPVTKPTETPAPHDNFITPTSRLVNTNVERRIKVKDRENFQFTHGMVEMPNKLNCDFNKITSPTSKSITSDKNVSPFAGIVNRPSRNMITTVSNFPVNGNNLVASTMNQNFPVYCQPKIPVVPLDAGMVQVDPTMNNMIIVEYEPVVVNSTAAGIKQATGACFGNNKGGVLGNQGHILPSTLMQPTMRPSFPVCRPQLIYRTHLKFDTNAAYIHQLENELNSTDVENLDEQRQQLRHLVSAVPSSSESNFDVANMIVSESEYASESSRPVSCSTFAGERASRRFARMAEQVSLINEVSSRLKLAEQKA